MATDKSGSQIDISDGNSSGFHTACSYERDEFAFFERDGASAGMTPKELKNRHLAVWIRPRLPASIS
jgi:hypothetical protein